MEIYGNVFIIIDSRIRDLELKYNTTLKDFNELFDKCKKDHTENTNVQLFRWRNLLGVYEARINELKSLRKELENYGNRIKSLR